MDQQITHKNLTYTYLYVLFICMILLVIIILFHSKFKTNLNKLWHQENTSPLLLYNYYTYYCYYYCIIRFKSSTRSVQIVVVFTCVTCTLAGRIQKVETISQLSTKIQKRFSMQYGLLLSQSCNLNYTNIINILCSAIVFYTI